MGNVERFIETLASPELLKNNRANAITTIIKNIKIDTCYAGDTRKWETGIQKPDSAWVIVKEYKNEKQAKIKHKEWVEKIKKNQTMKLKDCRSAVDWFLG